MNLFVFKTVYLTKLYSYSNKNNCLYWFPTETVTWVLDEIKLNHMVFNSIKTI